MACVGGDGCDDGCLDRDRSSVGPAGRSEVTSFPVCRRECHGSRQQRCQAGWWKRQARRAARANEGAAEPWNRVLEADSCKVREQNDSLDEE